MMIRRVLGAAALLLLAAAAPPGWGDLASWVGRYPTDSEAHPPARLLETPPLRAGLQQVLTAPDRAKLQALTNETPVEQSGTFIIVKQCMPHDCGNQNAMVVLDTISRRMWVGFFARTAHVNSTRWFGTSDVHDLTPDVLRIFDAQHTPQ